MKILFIMALFCSAFQANAFSGRLAWKNSNISGKVRLLNEYRNFYQNLHQKDSGQLSEFKTSKILSFLINEAWAATKFDCIYAGWPSQRIKGYCSSPLKNNPDYQSGNCSKSQMQCQPLFFGKGLCVPIGTQKERNLAFTNCDKQFKALNKSPDELIHEIRADGKEDELLELMDFADNICKESAQAKTGMCRRLEASVQGFRTAILNAPALQLENKTEVITEVINDGQKLSNSSSLKTEILDTVAIVSAIESVQNDLTILCKTEQTGTPFDREEPREIEREFVTSRPGADPAWEYNFVNDKIKDELIPTGFTFKNRGPNEIAGSPLDPNEKVERNWSFVSTDNSRRETYLWITDDAGSGYLSQLMESIILIIPRKMKPNIEAIDDNLHVTLTTGEKVIYDKETGIIKAGVLEEEKVDLTPDRFQRKFAPVSYSGTGISIRVDKRGEDPRLISGNAVITQAGKTCKVPAKELWDNEAEFRYADDSNLVEFLNKKCTEKFEI